MTAEVVLKKEYRGYKVIVRKLSWKPWKINTSLYPINSYWYCGYVELPKDSPFYGMDYELLEPFISVHGGLTFSGEIEEIDGYLIGFDCAHADDNPINQNENYTLKECESLVDQLISLSNVEDEKTYRYEVFCEIDIKAKSKEEAIKKLKNEYGSYFWNYLGIVNEDGEVEDED